jgi:hypothetical protein
MHKRIFLCWVLGSHGSYYKEYGLLVCNTI